MALKSARNALVLLSHDMAWPIPVGQQIAQMRTAPVLQLETHNQGWYACMHTGFVSAK